MSTSKTPKVWINQGLPSNLRSAHILLYVLGAFGMLIFLLVGGLPVEYRSFYSLMVRVLVNGQNLGVAETFQVVRVVGVLLVVGKIVAAYGIANTKRSGYFLGVIIAALPLCANIFLAIVELSPMILFSQPLSMIFAAATVGLLLHPDSRAHIRNWS